MWRNLQHTQMTSAHLDTFNIQVL